MFELFVEDHFSAAHHLREYPGNCANLHGHNWHVKLMVQADSVNHLGMALDFRKLKQSLSDILDGLDHKYINDLPEFKLTNPTCELLAQYIYRKAAGMLNDGRIKVARVEVHETPRAGAVYFE